MRRHVLTAVCAGATDQVTAAAPAGGVGRYLAIGDLLTRYVGAPREQSGSFPALLAERRRADGYTADDIANGISVEDGIHSTPDAYEAWVTRLGRAVPVPCG